MIPCRIVTDEQYKEGFIKLDSRGHVTKHPWKLYPCVLQPPDATYWTVVDNRSEQFEVDSTRKPLSIDFATSETVRFITDIKYLKEIKGAYIAEEAYLHLKHVNKELQKKHNDVRDRCRRLILENIRLAIENNKFRKEQEKTKSAPAFDPTAVDWLKDELKTLYDLSKAPVDLENKKPKTDGSYPWGRK